MLGLFKVDASFQALFKRQFCIENTILFIITMVGKQAFNNIKELVLIKSRQFSRSVQWRRKTKLKQWEMDYKLDFDHTLYDGKFV